jgi:hypothetical protein
MVLSEGKASFERCSRGTLSGKPFPPVRIKVLGNSPMPLLIGPKWSVSV